MIDIYQIDAFTDKIFGGNPAAVCPLDAFLPDTTLQNIAMENNLSETAFFIPSQNDETDFELRWFTPNGEVDLCGHATLAAAFVIFNQLNFEKKTIRFSSKSGVLSVEKIDSLRLRMDFPAWDITNTPLREDLITVLGRNPSKLYQGKYWLATFDSEEDVKNLSPDFKGLKDIDDIDFMIVSAQSSQADIDFVYRFFCPKYNIDEDPVTGSAQCILTPYWAKHLNKDALHAYQASARGGHLLCENAQERIYISGQAKLYLHGKIHV